MRRLAQSARIARSFASSPPSGGSSGSGSRLDKASTSDCKQQLRYDHSLGRIATHQVGSALDFSVLHRTFAKHINANYLDALKAVIDNNNFVLTVGGDQLTGKSTLSSRLAKTIRGVHKSAGSIFRDTARRLDITVGELSKRAKETPLIDVKLDMEVCEMVARGVPGKVLIIEGRQPAIMAAYIRKLGKVECASIYLTCSIREQALRFLKREINLEVFNKAEQKLPDRPYSSLQEVAKMISELNLVDDSILNEFVSNQTRDEDDRVRYRSLYGTLDYKDPGLYDIIVDTTPNQPEDTFEQATLALQQLKPEPFRLGASA